MPRRAARSRWSSSRPPRPRSITCLGSRSASRRGAGRGAAARRSRRTRSDCPSTRATQPTGPRRESLRIAFLRIAGRPVAMQIAVERAQRLWLLKIGYDEEYARCSPGQLLMLEVAAAVCERRPGSRRVPRARRRRGRACGHIRSVRAWPPRSTRVAPARRCRSPATPGGSSAGSSRRGRRDDASRAYRASRDPPLRGGARARRRARPGGHPRPLRPRSHSGTAPATHRSGSPPSTSARSPRSPRPGSTRTPR